MIICRTPTRISFFGGGTDYPIWYKEHGGMVLNTAINKFSYITVRYLPKFFDYNYRIRYYQTEETQTLDEIKHPSVRESARQLGITEGFEVAHNSDLPARTGLGSSSTFTVGMLHALYALKNYMPTKRELALEALHVEQNLIGESVGSQDQVAAAWGGLNKITFGGDRVFDVEPIIISKERDYSFQENLMLCFTGFQRSAPEIAKFQILETPQKYRELKEMEHLTREAFGVLTNPEKDLDTFGSLLALQWNIKKSMSPHVSNAKIDEIYEVGLRSGALGGKLLGAGGGGFMLFYAPKERQASIKAALDEKLFVPFRFEKNGSQIVYFSHE
jgi:D-glycero-alpha-D-manno-heptose-7-phosphate kinase